MLACHVLLSDKHILRLLHVLISKDSLHSRHLLHETYKLYLVSVLLEASGLTLLTTYYSIYAQYGAANEALKFIGKTHVSFYLISCPELDIYP